MLIQCYYFIGKSYLLKCIANYAAEHGYNVCVSAPTGKLTSHYARDLELVRYTCTPYR